MFTTILATIPDNWMPLVYIGIAIAVVLILIKGAATIVGAQYIPNDRVGIVEKFWSQKGSVSEGHILALDGQAGYQADILRGGLHFWFWRWQYRVHKMPLVTIPQGKIGYVYARDGSSLQPSQTLGRIVSCNNFQDPRAFLGTGKTEAGQRGRQRS